MKRSLLRAALVLLALAPAACGDDEAEPGAAVVRDTAAAVDGLSREQIEERARAMSPEQAESLGIIDTITRIEPPVAPDTLFDGPLLLDDSAAARPRVDR